MPELIAFFNGLSLVFLLSGFAAIKKLKIKLHRLFMTMAFISSSLFLILYLVHHYQVGSLPYNRHDWTRALYFIVLIPHVLLAGVMVPFIFFALKYALKNEIDKHRRITRVLFPVWAYVSFTGLIVYYMLYHLS